MYIHAIRKTSISLKQLKLATLLFTLGSIPGLAFASGFHHHERIEHRIEEMHEKLKITAEQEALWSKVDQAMREDAKTMDGLTQARADHAKDMTAIDDLKSYGEITTAHADGINRLIPVFSDLYATMSDAQKKSADTLFRHGEHKHGKHHNHKMSVEN
jgi:hypothetical protein